MMRIRSRTTERLPRRAAGPASPRSGVRLGMIALAVLGVGALLLWLPGACAPDAPVLSGIPARPLLAKPTKAPATPHASSAAPGYQKADNVYIDVHHLGGRDYEEVRHIIFDQLGGLVEKVDLPAGNGREYRFERGILRVADGRIYMVRVPLPKPLRRSDALIALGFPPYVGNYLTFSREYRLNHEWGFRRIRLMRKDRQSERVTLVEAWYSVPGEQH